MLNLLQGIAKFYKLVASELLGEINKSPHIEI